MVVCYAVIAFAILYANINSVKNNVLSSVCYSAENVVAQKVNDITDVEQILYNNRNIQDFLNEKDKNKADSLKIDAAGSIQSPINVKGSGMGATLFKDDNDKQVLSCNANAKEEEAIANIYKQYINNNDNDLFIYEIEKSVFSELYICHFTPVKYHSMSEVETYNVGTLAVFSKINIYELKNNFEKSAVMRVSLKNNETKDSIVIVDTLNGKSKSKGKVQTQRIGYTDWNIRVELFDVAGVKVISPFFILSFVLIISFVIYALTLRKVIRTSIDKPVQRISHYLEEFMLSKKDRDILKTVGIKEFDDILIFINELFERITEQAHLVIQTQQEMYEKELLASEQSLYMNQLQINPHFLFNTLNTITQMCLANGIEEVTAITQNIADIFRYSIEGDYKSTLDDEIYIVLKYLKIFNNRYGREFKCDLNIDDDLYEFPVLKMSLQPLIENVFKHGDIANNDNPIIKISAYRKNGFVIISVWDNGCGVEENRLQEICNNLCANNTQSDRSIGLVNINKRLKAYYGDKGGLEIHSEYGKYTEVLIKIYETNRDR